MNLTPEQEKELAHFPPALRALVEAELAAGNAVAAIEGGFPAAPCGASVKLAQAASETHRKSTDEVSFYERNNSSHAGEFTTAERHFFVLEPPLPPPPDPDMDAIRKAYEPRPASFVMPTQREGASGKGAQASRESTSSDPTGQEATPPFTSTETATGWTRVVHFRDERPPHLVQFELERVLVTLFTVTINIDQLRMNATAHVNGARYDFEVRFLAALDSDNVYALHTEASWAGSKETFYDYFRKTSDSWFNLWTRGLTGADLADAKCNLVDHYQRHCEATLSAQRHLPSIAAVQGAIVDGMKRGGSYHHSTKEGDTNIYWRVDHFVRSDTGDYPDLALFTNEEAFLQMLWNFCQFDATRHAGPQGLSEMDTWKLILRRMRP